MTNVIIEIPFTDYQKSLEAQTTLGIIRRMLMKDSYVSTSDLRTILGMENPVKGNEDGHMD